MSEKGGNVNKVVILELVAEFIAALYSYGVRLQPVNYQWVAMVYLRDGNWRMLVDIRRHRTSDIGRPMPAENIRLVGICVVLARKICRNVTDCYDNKSATT